MSCETYTRVPVIPRTHVETVIVLYCKGTQYVHLGKEATAGVIKYQG